MGAYFAKNLLSALQYALLHLYDLQNVLSDVWHLLRLSVSVPPNIYREKMQPRMDEYARIASRTRDLEQQYTKRVYEEYSKRVAELNAEIAELKAKEISTVQSKELEEELCECRKRIEELEEVLEAERGQLEERSREMSELSKRCKELEKTNRQLEERERMRQEEQTHEKTICKDAMDSEMAEKYRREQKDLLEQLRAAQAETSIALKAMKSSVDERKASNVRIEELIRRALQTDKKQNERKGSSNFDETFRARLSELEKRHDELKDENMRLKEDLLSEKRAVEETKSSVLLLRSSVAAKEKIIERQEAEIERLKLLTANPFQVATTNDLAYAPEPERDEAILGPKKRKGASSSSKESEKKSNTAKSIDIKKIIKTENRSFFNNLSFTNSSPMPDKKRGKN